ncbi:MAG: Omp28-related outer membrane protein [Bacteroidales bacterium]|nr:Omp28-related outer membrane protein [Bacteroidales bacterium]
MKMNLIKKISILSLLVLGLSFCDKVEGPYFKVPPKEVKTKALLEIFTGHQAANSPAVMEKVDKLKETYGDQLNVVVYHAGADAETNGIYTTNFTTAAGTQLYTDCEVTESATGMVNRGEITSSENWEAEIIKQIGNESKVDLTIQDNYNLETRELSVSLDCNIMKRIDSTIHIAAYVVEQDLMAPQNSEAGDILDYTHKHLFRKALNGDVYNGFEINDPEKYKKYSTTFDLFTVPGNWSEDNLHIVVVAYTGDEKAPLILHTEDILIDSDPPIEKKRKILIDESTGHRCTNCPEGHELIHDFKAKYPGRVVSISYHYDQTAEPGSAPFENDYRTESGNEIVEKLGTLYNPMASINRVDALFPYDWTAAVDQAVVQEAEAGMRIKTVYNSETRLLKASVSTQIYSDTISCPVWINVVVTESNKVSAQLSGLSDTLFTYVHNDIYRGPMNSTWGEELTNQASSEIKYRSKFSMKLEEDWAEENLSVIAYVYRADNKRIIQAEEIHLSTK